MSVETEIYSRLSGYAGLITLIGVSTKDSRPKIYALVLPQDQSLPMVTYFIVSNVPEHCMGADADIVTVRLQVSSWADSYLKAKAVAAQVKAALSRYRSSPIQDIFLDNEMDDFEPDVEEYQIIQDYTVFYSNV